jgi:hypothetical protein
LAFDLNNCGMRSHPYSAEPFQGITFWHQSTTAVRFFVTSYVVLPANEGGTCMPGGPGLECNNPHGFDLPPSAGRTVTIAFTELDQQYGRLTTFDETRLKLVMWQVGANLSFDFTIDNVAFVP